MFKRKILPLTFVFIISFYVYLYGDIIVTNDEMILNGKIIEDKKNDYIKFGNYHGTFHIEYRQIKEIHRTKSFEEDIKIFQDKGKLVNEDEVKTNYQAGLEKLEKQENIEKITIEGEIRKECVTVFITPSFNFNLGRLRSELPYGFGGSLIGDIALDQLSYFKKTSLSGVRAEIGYFHSEKGVKKVLGIRASAGPLWCFPLSIGGIGFDYTVSPVIGIGWYGIKGSEENADSVKLNAAFITGPVFNISAIVFAPLVRFDYIYDGVVPLYGMGLGISIGYRF